MKRRSACSTPAFMRHGHCVCAHGLESATILATHPLRHSRRFHFHGSTNANHGVAGAAQRLDGLRRAMAEPARPRASEARGRAGLSRPCAAPRCRRAAAKLKNRTLTTLYNERPAWLDNAHRELDVAVAAAYGWPENISTEDALAALLDMNRERAAAQVMHS